MFVICWFRRESATGNWLSAYFIIEQNSKELLRSSIYDSYNSSLLHIHKRGVFLLILDLKARNSSTLHRLSAFIIYVIGMILRISTTPGSVTRCDRSDWLGSLAVGALNTDHATMQQLLPVCGLQTLLIGFHCFVDTISVFRCS